MEYIVVAFRSRAHTVAFYEFLKGHGVSAEIVNTPKEAGVGCGLSVKVSAHILGAVKKAVSMTAFNSFAGFFLVKNLAGQRIVKSI